MNNDILSHRDLSIGNLTFIKATTPLLVKLFLPRCKETKLSHLCLANSSKATSDSELEAKLYLSFST